MCSISTGDLLARAGGAGSARCPRPTLPYPTHSGSRGTLFSMTTIDVDRARGETPGCREVAHLNNAGASLLPQPVIDAQLTWLREEAPTGGYEYAAAHDADRMRVYDDVAALIGARAHEIALMENATVAWHQAFWSLPLRPGDRILTCEAEYASSYISYLQAVERTGVRVEVVPSDADGQIDVDDLARRLDDGRGPVGLVG